MSRGLGSFRYNADGTVAEHDLMIVDGNLQIVDAKEEVQQRAMCKVLFLRGDDLFAPLKGIPYREDIMERPITIGLAASIITRAIEEEREILSVEEVETEIVDRELIYTARRVVTAYGPTAVSNG